MITSFTDLLILLANSDWCKRCRTFGNNKFHFFLLFFHFVFLRVYYRQSLPNFTIPSSPYPCYRQSIQQLTYINNNVVVILIALGHLVSFFFIFFCQQQSLLTMPLALIWLKTNEHTMRLINHKWMLFDYFYLWTFYFRLIGNGIDGSRTDLLYWIF